MTEISHSKFSLDLDDIRKLKFGTFEPQSAIEVWNNLGTIEKGALASGILLLIFLGYMSMTQ